MIKVTNLSKIYGSVKAIDNISFHVKKGEIVGFLGPNGAGKTTTMRILTCFMPASLGSATVAGYDVFEQAYEVKKRIGYLPENPPVYPEMAVTDYLKYVAQIKGVPNNQITAAISSVVEKCHLGSVQKRLIGHLSKGFRQRVGLAQALVHDPELLILDEPTVGLDPKQIIDIRGLIKQLAGEHTVILSTHILPEVTQTCERIIIINEGRIVAVDTFEELTSQLRKTEKIEVRLKNLDDAVDKVRGLSGVINVSRPEGENGLLLVETKVSDEVRVGLSNLIVKNNYGLLEMKIQKASLEDVFLKLTTTEEVAGAR